MNNSKFLRRTLSAFLAAAMAVSMAGCGAKESTKNLHTNEARQIVNYFTNTDFVMPSSVGDTQDIFYANDKVYVYGSASTEEAEKKAQIFDLVTKEEKEIDLSLLDSEYISTAFLSGSTAYICGQNMTGESKIMAFDVNTGSISGEVNFDASTFPTDIRTNDKGEIEIVRMKWGMMSAVTDFVIYEPGTLKEKECINVSEKMGFGVQESAVSILTGKDGSYYILSVVYDYQTGVANLKYYKTDAEFNTEFTIDGFSDMEGEPQAMIMLKNGNPCIISSPDMSKFSFDEIDAATGDIVNMYDFEIGGYPTIIKGMEYGDADFAFKTDEGIFKLSMDSKKPEKVYSFGTDISEDYIDSNVMSCSGNSMFLYTEIWGNASQALFTFDKEGNELGTIPLSIEESEYLNQIAVGKDGNLYCLVEKGESLNEDGDMSYITNYTIKVLSSEGELLKSISADALSGKADTYAQGFTVTKEGKILISTTCYSQETGSASSALFAYDTDGNELGSISDENISYIEGMFSCAGSEYVIYRDSNYNAAVVKADIAGGKLGEKCEFDIPVNMNVIESDDDRYDFCYRTSEGVYGYSINDKKSTEIINWIDSDIYSDISSVALAGDDSMFCLGYDTENGQTSISLLKRADEETLKLIQNKKIITVAGMDVSYNDALQSRVVDFNKNNNEYRVQINDYNKYSSYEDDTFKSGMFKLNEDISSGNIPDIIIGNAEVDMTSYTAKGILEDLKPYIEKDEEINMEDYFGNIMDIYSYNGKLCQLVTNFSVLSLAAKASEAGAEAGWNYNDFFAFTDKGNVFYKVKKTELADLFIKRNLSEFVDFENKTCSFDNDNFIKLLEMIEREGIDKDEDEDMLRGGYYGDPDYAARWKNGKCRLESLDLYGFYRLLDLQQGPVQEEVSLKGFPTEEGNGSLIAADATFAICSKSKNKDAAWAFLREFMLSDYQENLNANYTFTFPMMKSAFESVVKKAMSDEEQGYSTMTPDGQYAALKPLDSATADKIRGVITNANRAMISDERIGKIIDEQLTEFFAGSKSAQDAASAVQNKVSLYLKEIK